MSGSVLVLPVLYNSTSSGISLGERLAGRAASEDMDVVLSDNSPTADQRLYEFAKDHPGIRVHHYPDNPGYLGAPKRVLSELVAASGPLSYRAVVVCNTDLELDADDLIDTVREMEQFDPSCSWVLGPDIVEPDGRLLNPHIMRRPSGLRSLAQRSLGFSYVTATAYRAFSRLSVSFTKPKAERYAAGSTMFAPHGAMMIFGSGYFRSGGTFPDGPLFNEEIAVGRLAEYTSTPVIYAPRLKVRHEGKLTTGAALSRQRYELSRDAWRFYDRWRPRYSAGLMTDWFTDRQAD